MYLRQSASAAHISAAGSALLTSRNKSRALCNAKRARRKLIWSFQSSNQAYQQIQYNTEAQIKAISKNNSNTTAYQHHETNIDDDDYSKSVSFLRQNSLTIFSKNTQAMFNENRSVNQSNQGKIETHFLLAPSTLMARKRDWVLRRNSFPILYQDCSNKIQHEIELQIQAISKITPLHYHVLWTLMIWDRESKSLHLYANNFNVSYQSYQRNIQQNRARNWPRIKQSASTI